MNKKPTICVECEHCEFAEPVYDGYYEYTGEYTGPTLPQVYYPPRYYRCNNKSAAPISLVTGKPRTDKCREINRGDCAYWEGKKQ